MLFQEHIDGQCDQGEKGILIEAWVPDDLDCNALKQKLKHQGPRIEVCAG
jgi:hypothetical protein